MGAPHVRGGAHFIYQKGVSREHRHDHDFLPARFGVCERKGYACLACRRDVRTFDVLQDHSGNCCAGDVFQYARCEEADLILHCCLRRPFDCVVALYIPGYMVYGAPNFWLPQYLWSLGTIVSLCTSAGSIASLGMAK